MLAEAEKRDHRRLAAELDLVSWPDELGPGLAVWHPKGALIRKIMEDYSRDRHETAGTSSCSRRTFAKSVLWETSGHLDFYADGMYPPMEMDGATYYPKPMNCPFHVMIYKANQRSYRELPVRLFELGAVYRYELSGAVHGLMRSRGFTQDDSHIFTTREDIQSELMSLLDFVLSVLRAFGFEDFQAKLSTRPPEKSVGEDELWDEATEGLRAALIAAGSTTSPTRAVVRSTARRSTSTSRTPSAGRGSCRPSSSTSTCPNVSISSTSPAMASASDP